MANFQLQAQQYRAGLRLLSIQELRGIWCLFLEFLVVLTTGNVLLDLFVLEMLLIGLPKSANGLKISLYPPLDALVFAEGMVCLIDLVDRGLEGAPLQFLLDLLLLLHLSQILFVFLTLRVIQSSNKLIPVGQLLLYMVLPVLLSVHSLHWANRRVDWRIHFYWVSSSKHHSFSQIGLVRAFDMVGLAVSPGVLLILYSEPLVGGECLQFLLRKSVVETDVAPKGLQLLDG